VILPAFMKRFPGVTIDHIDATADQLLARIVSEVRGGRLFGDVFYLIWPKPPTKSSSRP
jgi:ABC-type Fe3+ transport system substrate-binding protein